LQKRLRKKNATEQITKEVPSVYLVYDIIYLNGEVMIRKPLRQRKEILSKISFREPLRFPRIKNIRIDKTVKDIDSLPKIKQIYNKQVYLMSKNNV